MTIVFLYRAATAGGTYIDPDPIAIIFSGVLSVPVYFFVRRIIRDGNLHRRIIYSNVTWDLFRSIVLEGFSPPVSPTQDTDAPGTSITLMDVRFKSSLGGSKMLLRTPNPFTDRDEFIEAINVRLSSEIGRHWNPLTRRELLGISVGIAGCIMPVPWIVELLM